MDLTSTHPYWTLKNGILINFPPLTSNLRCDIVVLGAGITGALVAEALTADGHDVVMLDSRDVAHGSTSASTALLQYEVDTHLIDLIKIHGKKHAQMAYQACHESIDMLDNLIRELNLTECDFVRKESVYLASGKNDVYTLRRESAARREMGINVTDLSENDVFSNFGFKKPGALHSVQAAEVDAYRLSVGLLKVISDRGGRIFDRTQATDVKVDSSGAKIQTNRGYTIHAKRIVVATGYESQELFDTAKFVNLHSSFAVASEPLSEEQHWWHRCLLWESARPYFYLRTDSDGRAILGGEDIPFRNAKARDKLIPHKSKKLANRFAEMFPDAAMEVAYSWAGTFGETNDGLAYIGRYQKYPLCFFALGFGGNGITYSVIAAEMIRKEIHEIKHPYSPVFSFKRAK